jgi:hypothetical protein
MTPIILGVWLYLTVLALRKYNSLMKMPGTGRFMTRSELKSTTDPKVVEAVKQWRRVKRRLFLLSVVTIFGYIFITMIISRAGWFINESK